MELVRLKKQYKALLDDMMDEWCASGEKIVPWAIVKNDYRNFDYYIAHLDIKEPEAGKVPDSVYFALDTDRNQFVGAVNIRHELNEGLLKNGGHIGDGIRPSRRREGLGTQLLGLALEKCAELGIEKALVVCDKENVGSAKCIQKNGGVLENEIAEEDGTMEQRYWITIPKQPLICGIHHVSLKCNTQTEFEKAVKFYHQTLGMEIVRTWGKDNTAGIMLNAGSSGLLEIFANGTNHPGQGAVRHFALATKSVDECVKAVQDAGYSLIVNPKEIQIQSDPLFPARIAFCIGPVGEEIEFFQER